MPHLSKFLYLVLLAAALLKVDASFATEGNIQSCKKNCQKELGVCRLNNGPRYYVGQCEDIASGCVKSCDAHCTAKGCTPR